MTTLRIVKICGTDVSSRSRASELRRKITSLVSDTQSQVELNFRGVRTVSNSFADELFGVLARDNGNAWFRAWIVITNLDEFPRETIVESINNRLQLT